MPEIQLSTPIDLTATADDGYHGLTAAAAGVTATDAFDDPAWLMLTSDAPEVLPIGSNLVTWTVTDLSGNTATEQQTIVVHARVLTSLTYSGRRRVEVTGRSSSFTAGAILSAPSQACVADQPIRFTLDRDPLTGNAVMTVLGTAMTNADGKAKLKVATGAWRAGTYTLTILYDGNNLGCVGSSTSVTLTVVVRSTTRGVIHP